MLKDGGGGWRILTRIAIDELENFRLIFQDTQTVAFVLYFLDFLQYRQRRELLFRTV